MIELGGNDLNFIGPSLYNLTELRIIILEKNRIDDIDLAAFAKLPKLRQFSLKQSGFTFATTTIECGQKFNSSLEALDLRSNSLSDATELNALRIFPNLKHLNLFGNPYENLVIGGNKTLKDILPSLNDLHCPFSIKEKMEISTAKYECR